MCVSLSFETVSQDKKEQEEFIELIFCQAKFFAYRKVFDLPLFVLFALTQKVPKKSRQKNAPLHSPLHARFFASPAHW